MKKNIFLTGAPGIGKTTVIKKIMEKCRFPMRGFYTEEERVEGIRAGFLMHSLDGKTGYLAHRDIKSPFHIRRYGVSIVNVEKIAAASIAVHEDKLIILDEIGKMECFSPIFREAALAALDSTNIVIGTITLGGGEFIESIKNRNDIEIIEVTLENRDELPEIIIQKAELIAD